MSNNSIILFKFSGPVGLGACISHMSLFNNSSNNFKFYFNNKVTQKRCDLLKRFFKMNNIKIGHCIINEKHNIMNNFNITENSSFFSNYIELNNELKLENVNNRNNIAVSFFPFSIKVLEKMFSDRNILNSSWKEYKNFNLKLPFNKYITINNRILLINHLKKLNFNVINFDDISKSDLLYKIKELQKVELLITYEGGMAHLAHILGIPTIIWKWNKFINYSNFFKDFGLKKSSRNYRIDEFENPILIKDTMLLVQSLHLADDCLFIDDAEELLNWNYTDFKNMINKLKNREGNNEFMKYPFIVNEIKSDAKSTWPFYEKAKSVTLKGNINNKEFEFDTSQDIYDFAKEKYGTLRMGNKIPIVFNLDK